MPFVPFHEKTPDPNTRVWVRIIGLVDSLVLANQDQLKDWQKHFSEVDEWLDESVTEDMVKDLEFQIEGNWASCAAVTGNYEVAFFGREQSFEYAVGDGSGWKKCDSQAHGIALCNQHHKKIILSQLK